MKYITCCVDCPPERVEQLSAMIDTAIQITYRTLRRHVSREQLADVFPGYDWTRRPRDLTMRRDWAVSYHRSTFEGRRVYYVRWSAIEFIFG